MKSYAWLLLTAITITSLGCVAQSQADKYRNLYRQSQSQVMDLQARLEESQARIDALQAEPREDAQLRADLQAALAERARLQAALDEAKQRLIDLASAPSSPLPVVLSSKLEALAAANPQLMSYDAKSGMVRLQSDLTFALGKTEVSSQAAATLGKLARVLNTPEAQAYEVRVVGHTDNVPVKNAANRAKFGDNWGLSAGRAIAVKSVLQKSGIAPTRIGIGGYGEFRPIVANGVGGAQANRRVEIFLVAMPANVPPTPAVVAPAPTKPAPAPAPAAKPAGTPAIYK
ncbi:OmpA family protein [Poriferisphaera sp. WC338]|uniref:OmpA/MotB family protein n=1 Tax=Poriferisphaera sp. WC338 TaxID=3425129 RepID=UPI003D81AE9C